MELEVLPVTNASRMVNITATTSQVLTSSTGVLSLDDLADKVAEVSEIEGGVSGLDVREAVWRLVDNQIAVFTPDRGVEALR